MLSVTTGCNYERHAWLTQKLTKGFPYFLSARVHFVYKLKTSHRQFLNTTMCAQPLFAVRMDRPTRYDICPHFRRPRDCAKTKGSACGTHTPASTDGTLLTRRDALRPLVITIHDAIDKAYAYHLRYTVPSSVLAVRSCVCVCVCRNLTEKNNGNTNAAWIPCGYPCGVILGKCYVCSMCGP